MFNLDKIYDLLFELVCKHILSPVTWGNEEHVDRTKPGIHLWEVANPQPPANVKSKDMILMVTDTGNVFEFHKVVLTYKGTHVTLHYVEPGLEPIYIIEENGVTAFLKYIHWFYKDKLSFSAELRAGMKELGITISNDHACPEYSRNQLTSLHTASGISPMFEPKAPVLEITPPGNYDEFMSLVEETLFTQGFFSPCEFNEKWITSHRELNCNRIANEVQPGVYHSDDEGGNKHLLIVLPGREVLAVYRCKQNEWLPDSGVYFWSSTCGMNDIFKGLNSGVPTLAHSGYVFIKHLVDTRVLWSGSI